MSSIITLVGGGGKTSLMCFLAEFAASLGKRVVATTTTKLWLKGPNPGKLVFAQTLRDCSDLINTCGSEKMLTLVKNIYAENKNKAEGFLPEQIDCLAALFPDICFVVEGDGACGKPLKGHYAYEPVIPQASSILLPVVGIDALNKPLIEQNVHRAAIAADKINKPYGIAIDVQDIVQLLLSPAGYLRNCPAGCRVIPAINKVEDKYRETAAYTMAGKILEKKLPAIPGVLIGSVWQERFTFVTARQKINFKEIAKKYIFTKNINTRR